MELGEPIRSIPSAAGDPDLAHNLTGISPIAQLTSRPVTHDAIQWSADNLIAVVGALNVDVIVRIPSIVSAGRFSLLMQAYRTPAARMGQPTSPIFS